MLAALPTLVASMLTVTVPADGSADCPSPRQVTEALNRVAPGSVSPEDGAPGAPDAGAGAAGLRLSVSGTPAGDVRIDLADARGEIVLRRLLRAPERASLSDCTALAETTAFIVERYLREVGYEAPPLPPPEPVAGPPPPAPKAEPAQTTTVEGGGAQTPARVTWRLGVVGSARGGDAGGLDDDGALAVGVDGARVGVRLSAGVAPRAHARWSANETAELLRVPLRLGLFVRVPLGPGHLEPGLGAGVDAFFLTTNAPGGASGRRLAPFGDLALGYALPLAGPLYVRILARGAVAVPYDFKIMAGEAVWTTPRFLGEGGVELGFAFR